MDDRTTGMAATVEVLLVGARGTLSLIDGGRWRDNELRVILMAAGHRQVESVGAITSLVRSGHGSAAVPLLRPSCDELIWIKYLRTLDPAAANKLIRLRTRLDGFRAVTAQLSTTGGKQMRVLGFSRSALTRIEGALRQAEQDIVEMADLFGWPIRTTRDGKQRSDGPSVSIMAEETQSHELYNFVYGATSRAVHFSPHELLRRVQSAPGERFELSNSLFENQWSQFALHWGVEILLGILVELEDEFGDSMTHTMSGGDWERATTEFARFGRVPAITAAELGIRDGQIRWPSE